MYVNPLIGEIKATSRESIKQAVSEHGIFNNLSVIGKALTFEEIIDLVEMSLQARLNNSEDRNYSPSGNYLALKVWEVTPPTEEPSFWFERADEIGKIKRYEDGRVSIEGDVPTFLEEKVRREAEIAQTEPQKLGSMLHEILFSIGVRGSTDQSQTYNRGDMRVRQKLVYLHLNGLLRGRITEGSESLGSYSTYSGQNLFEVLSGIVVSNRTDGGTGAFQRFTDLYQGIVNEGEFSNDQQNRILSNVSAKQMSVLVKHIKNAAIPLYAMTARERIEIK